MNTAKPFAFVLMPFDKGFDDVYRLGIQATASAHGVIAERVDEQIYTESILERIYRQIDGADFIIADMTGKNPNVFYEVGYAHALGKICTLITQDDNDIPFDLKHHRHIVYESSIQKLKEELDKEIAWIKGELTRRKAEIFKVEVNPKNAKLTTNEYVHSGELDFFIDIHNTASRRSPELDAVYLYTSERWVLSQDGAECGHLCNEDSAGERKHLLSTKTRRLAEGAWTQIRCRAKTDFWRMYSGDALPQNEYTASGYITVEIATAEGSFRFRVEVDTRFDEIPF